MSPLIGRCRCGATWPRAERYGHCSGCHKTFTSVLAFDEHRIEDRQARHGRRCLTADEMRERGHTTDPSGFWRARDWEPMPASVRDAHERRRVSRQTAENGSGVPQVPPADSEPATGRAAPPEEAAS